ncbi:MAG TPA: hypothetical protein VK576_09870 [Thermoleophilia bacterium]|nr:hypothetical protein [Thermoleophilia bacterium]
MAARNCRNRAGDTVTTALAGAGDGAATVDGVGVGAVSDGAGTGVADGSVLAAVEAAATVAATLFTASACR